MNFNAHKKPWTFFNLGTMWSVGFATQCIACCFSIIIIIELSHVSTIRPRFAMNAGGLVWLLLLEC